MPLPRNLYLRADVVIAVACLLVALACAPPTRAQASATPPDDKTRGIELYKSGNTNGAVAALQFVVKQHKDDADAWYYLGLAYSRKNDVKQARKAFERAVKLRPDFDGAQTGLAYILLRANKLPDAEHAAQRALSLNGQNAEAYYVVGAVQLHQRKYTDALSASDAALRVKPDFAPAMLLKSQVLLGIYEEEAWEKLKTTVHSATPAAQGVTDDSGPDTSTRTARLREAAQSLERFLTLVPKHPDAAFWREQLEALRVYTDSPYGDAVYHWKEVTSRAVVLSKPEPTFTEEARQSNVQGTVVLRMVLAADGKVKYILAIKGLGGGLTEQAIVAARKIKFTPALKDGHPVSQFVTVAYNFHIF